MLLVVFLQSFKVPILHSFGHFDLINKDVFNVKVSWQRPAYSVSA